MATQNESYTCAVCGMRVEGKTEQVEHGRLGNNSLGSRRASLTTLVQADRNLLEGRGQVRSLVVCACAVLCCAVLCCAMQHLQGVGLTALEAWNPTSMAIFI